MVAQHQVEELNYVLTEFLELEAELRMVEACMGDNPDEEMEAIHAYALEKLNKLQELLVPEHVCEESFRDDILELMHI